MMVDRVVVEAGTVKNAVGNVIEMEVENGGVCLAVLRKEIVQDYLHEDKKG